MSKAPHSFIFRLFRWYCDPAIVDDIEGDLLERYERHYKNRKFPNWLLARDVLLLSGRESSEPRKNHEN